MKKKPKELDEMLRLLRREHDGFDDENPEPLRLVLRVGPEGLELSELDPDDGDPTRMMPREYEVSFVPGPDTIQ